MELQEGKSTFVHISTNTSVEKTDNGNVSVETGSLINSALSSLKRKLKETNSGDNSEDTDCSASDVKHKKCRNDDSEPHSQNSGNEAMGRDDHEIMSTSEVMAPTKGPDHIKQSKDKPDVKTSQANDKLDQNCSAENLPSHTHDDGNFDASGVIVSDVVDNEIESLCISSSTVEAARIEGSDVNTETLGSSDSEADLRITHTESLGSAVRLDSEDVASVDSPVEIADVDETSIDSEDGTDTASESSRSPSASNGEVTVIVNKKRPALEKDPLQVDISDVAASVSPSSPALTGGDVPQFQFVDVKEEPHDNEGDLQVEVLPENQLSGENVIKNEPFEEMSSVKDEEVKTEENYLMDYEIVPIVMMGDGSDDPEATSSGFPVHWRRDATTKLLELIKLRWEDLRGYKTRKKDIWKEIAQILQDHQKGVTSDHCARKWHGMKSCYVKHLKLKRRGDFLAKYPDYIEEMTSIFGEEFFPEAEADSTLQEEADSCLINDTIAEKLIDLMECQKEYMKAAAENHRELCKKLDLIIALSVSANAKKEHKVKVLYKGSEEHKLLSSNTSDSKT